MTKKYKDDEYCDVMELEEIVSDDDISDSTWDVIMRNDEVTPVYYVKQILMLVFQYSPTAANNMIYSIEAAGKNGTKVVATYSDMNEAYDRVEMVNAINKEEGEILFVDVVKRD